MHSTSSVRKTFFAARSFQFLFSTLPVAAVFALLGGCGSGNGTAPAPLNYTVSSGLLPSASASPTPFPTNFPFATPSPFAIPTPTPSASAPAQTITGALRIEDASGNVVAAPFTPMSGSAEFPSVIAANLVSPKFIFETNQPVTDPSGSRTVTNRRVEISLPGTTKAGNVIKLGTDTTRRSVNYRETLTSGAFTGLVYNYATPSTEDSGTITLVSLVGDVYTFEVDALLNSYATIATSSFRLRGTVSIYAPKPFDPLGGIGFNF